MYTKLFFLSGLPRTGSTLLSTILSQNKEIYSGGNSPVCQIMWDLHVSCHENARQQIAANNALDFPKQLISEVPRIYYKNKNNKFIIDKCRSWTIPENINLIQEYLTPNPKIIVLTRKTEDIIKSFIKLGGINSTSTNVEIDIFKENSDFLRSIYGVNYAKNNNLNNNFLFVDYEDIINNIDYVINAIYNFFEIKKYKHDYNNIKQKEIENDLIYGILDMHKIRNSISKIENNISVSQNTKLLCNKLDKLIY